MTRLLVIAFALALLIVALLGIPAQAGAAPPQARCKAGALLARPYAVCRAGKWYAISEKTYTILKNAAETGTKVGR